MKFLHHPDLFFHVLNEIFAPPWSFFHVLNEIFAPPCSLITSCSLNRYYCHCLQITAIQTLQVCAHLVVYSSNIFCWWGPGGRVGVYRPPIILADKFTLFLLGGILHYYYHLDFEIFPRPCWLVCSFRRNRESHEVRGATFIFRLYFSSEIYVWGLHMHISLAAYYIRFNASFL